MTFALLDDIDAATAALECMSVDVADYRTLDETALMELQKVGSCATSTANVRPTQVEARIWPASIG